MKKTDLLCWVYCWDVMQNWINFASTFSGMVTRIITVILCLLGTLVSAKGADIFVDGVVTDSLTKEPVPFAMIEAPGLNRSVQANANGRFSISVPAGTPLSVTQLGYSPKVVAAKRKLNVLISPDGVGLAEIVVRPKRQKYSKKNNPAVDFMQKIRSSSDLTDPRLQPFYNYDKYERITLALDNFSTENADGGDNGAAKRFPLLKEYVDTSAFNGNTILNVALREKASTVNHRGKPRTTRETVSGFRSEGIDQMIDPQATQILYEDVLREVDIYDNDITIMQNRFVSPLSRLAPDFYRFFLTDTIEVNGENCIVLTFTPQNPSSFGFVGRLYVPQNDTTYFVKRIEMSVPKNINLNFVKNLKIIQEYERGPEGLRLKMLDDMIVEVGVGKDPQLYGRRVSGYRGHNFNTPVDSMVFSRPAPSVLLKGATERNEAFWHPRRFIPISKSENAVGLMLDQMRQNKGFYWAEKILKVLVNGYITTGNPSKVDIGPVNTFVSFNDLEGLRLRGGFMTTANLSKRWLGKAYTAYGFGDHRWKYGVEGEFSFHDKDYHSREFPVHSLRATHKYDVDMLGTHFQFTNPDNFFLSFRRAKDTMMSYYRLTSLLYTLELENNFSFMAEAAVRRQEPSKFVWLFDGAGRFFNHWTTSALTLTFRYAPGEKFFQTKTNRLPVNMDAPIFQLSHTFAPSGCFGNRCAVNVTRASFQKRFWFSAFGYTDVILKAGHVWGSTSWLNLLMPNANLSYTIQPESFALLNPLEFINDSQAEWDLTYWANGALFNMIPGIKKLKLREVFAFRGVWGRLSDRNNPLLHPDLLRFPPNAFTRKMSDTPYMEISAGLDNVLRILRIEYVWRLTYRNTPDAPNSGLRIALHFSF